MRYSRSIGKEPNFHKIVIASAIFHLIFISVVAIPIKKREREFKSYFVNLVGPIQPPAKPAVRGPRTAPAQQYRKRTVPKKNIVRPQKTVPPPPEPEADISLEPVERVAKEIERIRAISALAKRKEEEQETQKVQIGGKESPEEIPQGMEISGTGQGAEFGYYYSSVSQKIWQQWVYPGHDQTGLEVVISIQINRDGIVMSQEIEKASGNMLFDRSAVKAISRASPLPPPPSGEIEIGVRFYL